MDSQGVNIYLYLAQNYMVLNGGRNLKSILNKLDINTKKKIISATQDAD